MQKNKILSGLIPANVSEKVLPIVPAGFAKDVEEVNQYAAPIYDATIKAIFSFLDIKINKTKPKVAIISEMNKLLPDLSFSENSTFSIPNK